MVTVMVMVTAMVRLRKNRRHRQSFLSPVPKERATIVRYVLIVGVTFLITFGAFANALSNVTKVSHPAVALRFNGSQPAALTALADENLINASQPKALNAAVRYATEAVRVSPLAPAALRILGLTSADARWPLAERPLLALSRKLSRRDLGTHLWWIEYYVGKGQAKETLQNYDLALRTSIPARSILLPVLYSALEYPEIQSELVHYLKEERAWVPELIIYATGSAHSVSRLVKPLVASGSYPRTEEFSHLARQTMENLIANGDFSGVEKVYAALPNADRNLLVQAKFSKEAANDQHIPVAWDLNGSSTAGAEMDGGQGSTGQSKYSLRAFAGAGESDTVARKLLFLKPGKYRFASTATVTLAAPQQEAAWVLSCITTSDVPLLSHNLVANQKPTPDTSDFQVPIGCPAQTLTLHLAAEGGMSGTEILVNLVDIKPM